MGLDEAMDKLLGTTDFQEEQRKREQNPSYKAKTKSRENFKWLQTSIVVFILLFCTYFLYSHQEMDAKKQTERYDRLKRDITYQQERIDRLYKSTEKLYETIDKLYERYIDLLKEKNKNGR